MGGSGSGGHNRLTDEEKRRRGTFQKQFSDEVYDARAAEKVIIGPWLSEIPQPELPLGEFGRKTYDDLTKMLFEQNKLTQVTCMLVEQVAALRQKQMNMMAAGKDPPVSLSNKISGLLANLRIAENAPTIASPGQKNRFAGSGFSNQRTSSVRLRPAASRS